MSNRLVGELRDLARRTRAANNNAAATELEQIADDIEREFERRWQPIDSAPHGVPVLTRKGRVCHVGTLGRFGWCDWAGRPLHPTHYMLIPMDEEVDDDQA